MKVSFVLACTYAILSIKRTHSTAIHAPFYPLEPEDLSEGEIKELEYWDKYYHRPKRAGSAWDSGSGQGSADIVNQLKSALAAGIKKKVGQIARGSAGAVAGASAGFSKGSFSSPGGHDSKYYPASHKPHPETYDHKNYDIWELKKSVLNTLLQAVKAIKGGVLAIKGQLIKGSGYIVSGGGKLIAASGDKVTQLGKNIISNAVLVHPNKGHPHDEYGPPPSSYSAPSGPAGVYEVPPSPSGLEYTPENQFEGHYDQHDEKLPSGTQAGILILRRIPANTDNYLSSPSQKEESKILPFKPLTTTGPSLGSIFGKFFTASTSLNPEKPTPFSHTPPAVDHDNGNSQGHYSVEENHEILKPPSYSHYEEPRNKFAPPTSEEHLVKEHKVVPTSSNADFSTSSSDFGNIPKPHSSLATSYEAPFQELPSFLNFKNHFGAEASNTKEEKVKLTRGELLDNLNASRSVASSQIYLPKNAPPSLKALKNIIKNDQQTTSPLSAQFLSNNGESFGELSSSKFLPNSSATTTFQNTLYSEENGFLPDLPSIHASVKDSTFKKSPSKSSFSQRLVPDTSPLANFLPRESQKSFQNSKEIFGGFSSDEKHHQGLESFHFQKLRPSSFTPSRYKKSNSKPSSSKVTVRIPNEKRPRRQDRPDFNIMKSIAYEITPDGPKRLT